MLRRFYLSCLILQAPLVALLHWEKNVVKVTALAATAKPLCFCTLQDSMDPVWSTFWGKFIAGPPNYYELHAKAGYQYSIRLSWQANVADMFSEFFLFSCCNHALDTCSFYGDDMCPSAIVKWKTVYALGSDDDKRITYTHTGADRTMYIKVSPYSALFYDYTITASRVAVPIQSPTAPFPTSSSGTVSGVGKDNAMIVGGIFLTLFILCAVYGHSGSNGTDNGHSTEYGLSQANSTISAISTGHFVDAQVISHHNPGVNHGEPAVHAVPVRRSTSEDDMNLPIAVAISEPSEQLDDDEISMNRIPHAVLVDEEE